VILNQVQERKKLIQLAYPNIRQALLTSWKEGGLAVEK
jgi:hypothetical protein